MDAVSLTVTPASEVNSAESGGLRVDGLDNCNQPIPAGILTATSGWIKFKYIPRHDVADFADFGNTTPYVFRLQNAAQYIALYHNAANRITLIFDDGGGAHLDSWNPATLNAGTEYAIEVKYNAAEMTLKVDGTIRATITTPIDFGAVIPSLAHWGTNEADILQSDIVIIAP